MAVFHSMTTRPAVLTCTLGALALSGWGALVYSGRSSAAVENELIGQVGRAKTERNQLLAERARLQEDVRALQERLAAARDEQSRTVRARDQAKAELATAQQQLAKRREFAKDRVAQVGPPTPAAPARVAEHAKERVAQADSVPPLLPPARIPERPKERAR
jgi:peptidoglycan hydrolase CwlO-like protein